MNTIKDIEIWLRSYIPNKKIMEKYLHGDCLTFSEDLQTLLKSDYEQWELYDLDEQYKDLSFVVNNVKLPDLCDIGQLWHVVIKWKGWFWDASGKHKTLEEKSIHYNKCPNPHWLRTL